MADPMASLEGGPDWTGLDFFGGETGPDRTGFKFEQSFFGPDRTGYLDRFLYLNFKFLFRYGDRSPWDFPESVF